MEEGAQQTTHHNLNMGRAGESHPVEGSPAGNLQCQGGFCNPLDHFPPSSAGVFARTGQGHVPHVTAPARCLRQRELSGGKGPMSHAVPASLLEGQKSPFRARHGQLSIALCRGDVA